MQVNSEEAPTPHGAALGNRRTGHAPTHASHETQRSHLRENLKICTLEGMLATPWTFLLLPSNFIWAAVLTQFFGIQNGVYGIIASLPAWSSCVQIILLSVVARFMNARDLALGLSWLNLGLWIMMTALLGYLPREDAGKVGHIFIIFFALNNLTHSFLAIGWQSWIQEFIPQRIRGTYFGRRNFLTSLSTVGFLVYVNLVFTVLGEHIYTYQIVIAVPLLMRFFSNLYQHRIENPRATNQPIVKRGWWAELFELRGYPQLLLFVMFSAWVGFWLNLINPFVPVFVYQELGWSPDQFNVLIIIATVAGALGQPVWGRMIDRHGCVPSILLALFMWETFSNIPWMFMRKEISWLMYPMWCTGGFASMGYFLGIFNLALKLMPPHLKGAGVSFNLAAVSMAAALAPIISGRLLQAGGTGGADLLPIYHWLFGIKSAAIYLGLAFLIVIKEPASGGLSELAGAMRTMRQIMQGSTLAIFSNLSPMGFRKRLEKKK